MTPRERRQRLRQAYARLADDIADILDDRDTRLRPQREPWRPDVVTTDEDEQDAARALQRGKRRSA